MLSINLTSSSPSAHTGHMKHNFNFKEKEESGKGKDKDNIHFQVDYKNLDLLRFFRILKRRINNRMITFSFKRGR